MFTHFVEAREAAGRERSIELLARVQTDGQRVVELGIEEAWTRQVDLKGDEPVRTQDPARVAQIGSEHRAWHVLKRHVCVHEVEIRIVEQRQVDPAVLVRSGVSDARQPLVTLSDHVRRHIHAVDLGHEWRQRPHHATDATPDLERAPPWLPVGADQPPDAFGRLPPRIRERIVGLPVFGRDPELGVMARAAVPVAFHLLDDVHGA